jgi:hypothetical protein
MMTPLLIRRFTRVFEVHYSVRGGYEEKVPHPCGIASIREAIILPARHPLSFLVIRA